MPGEGSSMHAPALLWPPNANGPPSQEACHRHAGHGVSEEYSRMRMTEAGPRCRRAGQETRLGLRGMTAARSPPPGRQLQQAEAPRLWRRSATLGRLGGLALLAWELRAGPGTAGRREQSRAPFSRRALAPPGEGCLRRWRPSPWRRPPRATRPVLPQCLAQVWDARLPCGGPSNPGAVGSTARLPDGRFTAPETGPRFWSQILGPISGTERGAHTVCVTFLGPKSGPRFRDQKTDPRMG